MLFVSIFALYLLLGILFGLYFAVTGYRKLLVAAAGTRLRVRLLWFWGAVGLWPLLLWQILFSNKTATSD